jgi:hypothetical protein
VCCGQTLVSSFVQLRKNRWRVVNRHFTTTDASFFASFRALVVKNEVTLASVVQESFSLSCMKFSVQIFEQETFSTFPTST